LRFNNTIEIDHCQNCQITLIHPQCRKWGNTKWFISAVFSIAATSR